MPRSARGGGKASSSVRDRHAELRLSQATYALLDITRALMRREDYTSAVGELALLIRKGYGKGMDKGVEAAMVNDVRLAVTIIERHAGPPRMLDAAAALVEAASRVLPQERSKQVVREHRKSLIALTRNHNKGVNVVQSGGDVNVMQQVDVLEQVFAYLEAPDLARASCVSKSWREASASPEVWRILYEKSFGSHLVLDGKRQPVCWKAAFLDARHHDPLSVPTTNRTLCRACGQLYWRSSTTCASGCPGPSSRLIPLKPQQVIRYLMDCLNSKPSQRLISNSDTSNSDTDSENEESSTGRGGIWKLPGQLRNLTLAT